MVELCNDSKAEAPHDVQKVVSAHGRSARIGRLWREGDAGTATSPRGHLGLPQQALLASLMLSSRFRDGLTLSAISGFHRGRSCDQWGTSAIEEFSSVSPARAGGYSESTSRAVNVYTDRCGSGVFHRLRR
jgi:hypothetical protein